MKNFIDNGDRITFTAPSGGVVGGAPLIHGDLFLIPSETVAETIKCTGMIEGTYDLAAVSGDAGDEGDAVYWDDTAKNVTLDPAAGVNKLVGVYAEEKTDGMLLVNVRLNGVSLGLE